MLLLQAFSKFYDVSATSFKVNIKMTTRFFLSNDFLELTDPLLKTLVCHILGYLRLVFDTVFHHGYITCKTR